MKKFSRKGVLLFAAAMAVSAVAVPSMAPAANWGPVGTEHTLDSPGLSYFVLPTNTNTSCGESSFTLNVASAAVVEITIATFRRCTTSGPLFGSCTQTWVATGLPWTATAVNTSNIQIHGIRIDMRMENHPGGSTACAAVGVDIVQTGTLTGGLWNGNAANQHELILSNAPGLTTHSFLGGNPPIFLNGTFRDTQQSLTVT